jgi:hypothetical protein
METDLSKDCLKIKEIYKKSRSRNISIEFLRKKTSAKIVFIIYILFLLAYVFLLYCNREDAKITTILAVFILFILCIFCLIFNKMIDKYLKDIMYIDNGKKYNILNLSNFLFRDKLNKDMVISVAKAEFIIKQLELENGNSNIPYFSKYVSYASFFTVLVVPTIIAIINSNLYMLIGFIAIGVVFIAIYHTIMNVIHQEKIINNDIIVRLKKYILDEQYKQTT